MFKIAGLKNPFTFSSFRLRTGNNPVSAAVAGGFRECAKALEDEVRRPQADILKLG